MVHIGVGLVASRASVLLPLALCRRAKYVAISRLTDDYLDTSGVLTSFEGELEGEEHLISLITQSGQFQWGTGDQLGSTYFPQVGHRPHSCHRLSIIMCGLKLTVCLVVAGGERVQHGQGLGPTLPPVRTAVQRPRALLAGLRARRRLPGRLQVADHCRQRLAAARREGAEAGGVGSPLRVCVAGAQGSCCMCPRPGLCGGRLCRVAREAASKARLVKRRTLSDQQHGDQTPF